LFFFFLAFRPAEGLSSVHQMFRELGYRHRLALSFPFWPTRPLPFFSSGWRFCSKKTPVQENLSASQPGVWNAELKESGRVISRYLVLHTQRAASIPFWSTILSQDRTIMSEIGTFSSPFRPVLLALSGFCDLSLFIPYLVTQIHTKRWTPKSSFPLPLVEVGFYQAGLVG